MTENYIENYQPGHHQRGHKEQLKFGELRKQLKELDEGFPALSEAQTIAEESPVRQTYVHLRGEYRQKGIPVAPATRPFCMPCRRDPGPPRLRLAKWIADPDNPLTARVTVNRIWQELFGRGIVRPPRTSAPRVKNLRIRHCSTGSPANSETEAAA